MEGLNKVWEIKTLQLAKESEARETLEKIAKQVQPIMHRRKYQVPLLSEFWPPERNLLGLNINAGQEIRVRLRKASDNMKFLRYEEVLDTMLHELSHNEFGPHDSDFYKLWDELRKECADLMKRGITGLGRKLGSGSSSNPSLSSVRKEALTAAEKARGPKRLGGDGSLSKLRPGDAALKAAERRIRDELWCASRAILKGSTSTSGKGVVSNSTSKKGTVSTSTSKKGTVSDSTSKTGAKNKGAMWQCNTCTLLNQPAAVRCEVCETPKSGSRGDNKSSRVWSCKHCTLNNGMEVDRCAVCGNRR